MRDLFGNEITEAEARRLNKTKGIRRGYAMPPGTGPAGETCKTCKHKVGRRFLKCDLMQRYWTHGFGSDILAKAPACGKWETKA